MLWRITAQYESTCTKSWQYTLQCIMVQLSEIGSFVSGYALLSQFYSFGSHFHQQSCRLPEGLKLRTKAAECTLMLLVKVLQAVISYSLVVCGWIHVSISLSITGRRSTSACLIWCEKYRFFNIDINTEFQYFIGDINIYRIVNILLLFQYIK